MRTGGTTTKGGGTTWDAQIMQGFGDVAAGLGGYAALEYRSQEAITLSQRRGEPWNVTDYTPWGGNNLNPGAVSSLARQPCRSRRRPISRIDRVPQVRGQQSRS